MPALRRQTARDRALTHYLHEVMARLEWDLHNTIELTGRIPAEWHDIAKAPPVPKQEKVNLRLEADVLKFFRSMGPGYGARINDVLRSYMYARLTGLLRGAETVDHWRVREALHAGPKPGFSGADPEGWRKDTGLARAKMQEVLQARYAEGGLPEGEAPGQRVR